MATTVLSVQTVTRAGITPSFTTPASVDGHTIANDGRMILEVKNAHATVPCVVTIVTPNTVDSTLGIADRTVTVAPITGDKIIGPFPTNVYGANMTVTFSAVTNVSCAAFKVVTG